MSFTDVALKRGTHVYNFVCQIPAVCPSSFEGTHGRVRYTVTVKVIRPWKFDLTYSRPFTVLKIMDLNREGLFLNVSLYEQSIYEQIRYKDRRIDSFLKKLYPA